MAVSSEQMIHFQKLSLYDTIEKKLVWQARVDAAVLSGVKMLHACTLHRTSDAKSEG